MILWLLATLAGCWLAYVVATAWALRSDTVRNALNKHPDRFSIQWRSGWSWFPGSFHIRGLHFVGQGTASQYYGRLDDARFRLQLFPLFRKTLSVGTFHGRGVEFQIRRPPPADGGPTDEASFAPPIPGLETLPHRTTPRRGPGTPSWWIHIETILFREIERIWLYESRLEGPGTLAARLDMQIEGPFHLRVRELDLPAATLSHRGANLATRLALRLDGELGPLTFGVDDVPDTRLFDFLSADLRVAGELETIALLREQLGSHDSIDFSGQGRVEGDVRVAKGILQPGTRLAIDSPKLRVTLGGFVFEGAATVEDHVALEEPQPLTRLAVHLRDLTIFRNGQPIGAVDGPVLNLTSTSKNRKLTSGFQDADLTLRLEPFVLPNASWLSEFLPAGSGVAILGGAITLGADLRASPRGPIHGRLDLSGDTVATRIHGSPYQGTVHLAIQLADGSGGPRVLHLERTKLTLTNLVVPNLARDSQEGWHAVLGVPSGRLDLTNRSWNLTSEFRIALRDTRPILAVLRNQPDAPNWLRLMPTIRQLEGTGRLEASRDRTRLSEFSLSGKATDFRAELLLSTNQPTGIAYARYGVLSAGFDLRDPGNSRWRILGAKRWFERALASPLHPPDWIESEETDAPNHALP